MREDKVGTVSHYYTHLGVAAIALQGELKVGDRIHIKGRTSDFIQTVDSMEKLHHGVERAGTGDSVGLKVVGHAREHDAVYRMVEERDAA